MADNAQSNIDSLITDIENAYDPESVTNGMVAAVLKHLNNKTKANTDAIADIGPVPLATVDEALLGLVPLDTTDPDYLKLVAQPWRLQAYAKQGVASASPLDNGTATFEADGDFSMDEDTGSIIEGGSFAQMVLTGGEAFTAYRSADDGALYIGFSGGAFPLIHDSAEDVNEFYRAELLEVLRSTVLSLTRPSGDGLDTVETLQFLAQT